MRIQSIEEEMDLVTYNDFINEYANDDPIDDNDLERLGTIHMSFNGEEYDVPVYLHNDTLMKGPARALYKKNSSIPIMNLVSKLTDTNLQAEMKRLLRTTFPRNSKVIRIVHYNNSTIYYYQYTKNRRVRYGKHTVTTTYYYY